MKEKDNSQLGFAEEEGRFLIPENVLDKIWGKSVIDFLEKREIWKNRPRGLAFCFEVVGEDFSEFTFNTSNWQIAKDFNEKRYSAALVLIANFSLFDQNILNIPLKKKAPVFVFERTSFDNHLDKDRKNERLGILKEWGLVERSIFANAAPGYLVWEARVEKKRISREINLLDKERHQRTYYWARKLWKEMASEYAACGFKIISGRDSEILEILRKSKNPPDDLGKLRMGWGVEIKNPSCGCHAKVSLNGDVDWIYSCGEESHHNFSMLGGRKK